MTEKILKHKPGRVDGKNSDYRSGTHRILKRCGHEIEMVLRTHRKKAAHSDKSVGSGTQDKRETAIKGFFSDLFHLGYKIESIHSLKQKHLSAVFYFLEEQGQSPSTIQNKISIMRVFCEWIGKCGMVGDSTKYVRDKESVRRSMVVTEDKSWDGNGVDVVAKLSEIAQLDKAVGLWLELCLAFGLRVKESLLFKANVAHEGDHVFVRDGTKGGRSRIVPVENVVQKDVLKRAKEEADGKTGLLGIRGKTLTQKTNRFYYILGKCRVTLKDDGITAHGLRHQYMQESFERLLGIKAPVKGGDLSLVDKDELRVASQKLVERAGHTRVTIGASYYGSRRPRSSKKVNSALNSDGVINTVDLYPKHSGE